MLFHFEPSANEDEREGPVEHVGPFEQVCHCGPDGRRLVAEHPDHKRLVEPSGKSCDLDGSSSNSRIVGPGEAISDPDDELRRETSFLVNALDEPHEPPDLPLTGQAVRKVDDVFVTDGGDVGALQNGERQIRRGLAAVRISEDAESVPRNVQLDQLVPMEGDCTAFGAQNVPPDGHLRAGWYLEPVLQRDQKGGACDLLGRQRASRIG